MKTGLEKYLLILFIPMLALNSCTAERKLAEDYVKNARQVAVQVLPPSYLLKTNDKTDSIPGLAKMNALSRDSILLDRSIFLKNISDSIFLETFVNSFIDELRALGFPVYLENDMNTFLEITSDAYMVNIAQVELEEYAVPVEDSDVFDDSTYYKIFHLNAVDMNTWFEVSKLNAGSKSREVLFGSYRVFDMLEGGFFQDPFTSEVKYKYALEPMKLNDIYVLADYIGKKYASFIYDYFMNRYIKANYPQNLPAPQYFHYDRQMKNVSPAYDERLITM